VESYDGFELALIGIFHFNVEIFILFMKHIIAVFEARI